MKRKLEELLGLDLRSLALFRAAIAVVLLSDLAVRASSLRDHYTDAGVLPRAALLEQFANAWHFSFYNAGGTTLFVALLFLVQAVFALMLLVGWRTRFSTAVSWALLVSLQNRNPALLQGGDILFRMLLLWGAFLPLGARWSVDAAMSEREKPLPDRILSFGSAAFTLQIAMVYVFSALMKTGPEWRDGSAVYYAFSLDMFVRPLGHALLAYPELLEFLTRFVWSFELLAPLLFFVPVATALFRGIGIAGFAGLQMAFNACLYLGEFPWVACAGLLALLPSAFWDGVFARLKTPVRSGLRIHYDADCGFCKKSVYLLRTFFLLPETRIVTAQGDARRTREMEEARSWVIVDSRDRSRVGYDGFLAIVEASPVLGPFRGFFAWAPVAALGGKTYRLVAGHRKQSSLALAALRFHPGEPVRLPLVVDALAAVFLAYALFWNVANLKSAHLSMPGKLRPLGAFFQIDQAWNMFSPAPSKEDGWYVIPAKLRDGSEVDLFRNGAPIAWDKPAVQEYPTQRWRKYYSNLCSIPYKDYRLGYGRWLCREWNRRHPHEKQAVEFEILYFCEYTQPDYKEPRIERMALWKHHCFHPSGGRVE